jgi:hypothetical protein
MSTHSFSPSASVGVGSLAILVAVFLAASPRPTSTPTEDSGTVEPVSVALAAPALGEAPIHDPSVPAASSVTFPAGDANEPAIASF